MNPQEVQKIITDAGNFGQKTSPEGAVEEIYDYMVEQGISPDTISTTPESVEFTPPFTPPPIDTAYVSPEEKQGPRKKYLIYLSENPSSE